MIIKMLSYMKFIEKINNWFDIPKNPYKFLIGFWWIPVCFISLFFCFDYNTLNPDVHQVPLSSVLIISLFFGLSIVNVLERYHKKVDNEIIYSIGEFYLLRKRKKI